MEVLRPFETTWEDWVLGGGVRAAFPDPSLPLEVEIGPGEDDFLLERASSRPTTNFLGVEYSHKRLVRYARRARALGGCERNLRLAWRPAADVVGPFLVPGAVAVFHVRFPDPWPKKHHARYRLLTPEFAATLAAALVPGGAVRLATDSPEYAAEIDAAFRSVPTLRAVAAGPGADALEPGERATPFEERWRAQGRTIHHLRFDRASAPE